MMNNETILVMTSLPDSQSAAQLAEKLITQRLAACVNSLAPCTSVYRWQGKMESATEIPLLIKTLRRHYDKVEQAICAAHPYELPEIIAIPIETGLPAYLNWVATETAMVGE